MKRSDSLYRNELPPLRYALDKFFLVPVILLLSLCIACSNPSGGDPDGGGNGGGGSGGNGGGGGGGSSNITAFSVLGTAGTVNTVNRTIDVIVPLNTDRTTMTPAITHSGGTA
jgi:hypothetical protein